MLYGMSLIYGITGATQPVRDRRVARAGSTGRQETLALASILFVVVGFAFKVSRGAVPVLGPRHLRGRARAGRGVPGDRVEGGRLRRAAAADVRGVPGQADVLDADLRGPVGRSR